MTGGHCKGDIPWASLAFTSFPPHKDMLLIAKESQPRVVRNVSALIVFVAARSARHRVRATKYVRPLGYGPN